MPAGTECGHRIRVGTRAGRRVGTARTQAILVLRWFRDDAPLRPLAAEAALPISTSYRYLHDGIDVIADQAPDLHEVLGRARWEGWSHVSLDGTLIEIDRVYERSEHGLGLEVDAGDAAASGFVAAVRNFPGCREPRCPPSAARHSTDRVGPIAHRNPGR